MIQASVLPADEMSGAKLDTAARRVLSGAGNNIADLKAQLSINSGQTRAWAAFAETLSANGRRLDAVDGVRDHPFGRVQDRLAAET